MNFIIRRCHSSSKYASVVFEYESEKVNLGLFDYDELDEFRSLLIEAMNDAEEVRDTLVRDRR